MNKNTIYSIVVLITTLFNLQLNAQDLYIAPNGNDANSGSINQPLKTLTGARNKARQTGAKTIWVRGGRYKSDRTCVLDGQDSGLTISGYGKEKAIFDGGIYVNPKSFKLVEGGDLNFLHQKAKGKVFSQTISDKKLIETLSQSGANISMNDRPMFISRFPNVGYAYLNYNTVTGETVNQKGSVSSPKGPRFKLNEKINAAKWNAELRRNNRAFTRGYISADWLKETNPVASVDGSGSIQLANGTRYGITKDDRRKGRVNRIYFLQLLCELDEPGEWYFDTKTNKLYVWPFSAINNTTKIGAWAGPEVITVKNASNIKIQRLIIQHIGKDKFGNAGISLRDSKRCEITGVTFRNIGGGLAPANVTGGEQSGIKSCDFIDNERGARLFGGVVKTNRVQHAKNYIINSHFTHINSKDFYGKAVGINGAGNIFKNNLVHNSNGQPITHYGNDHVIERNEIFNVGIEEGDGGAIYTGAALWSFGNKIRQNFIHHLMTIPTFYGKQGIYCDDNDGGDLIEQNYFYKGGMHAILTNGGPGHSVYNNIVVEGNIAIRSASGKGKATYDINMNYLKTNPKNKIKANYIGRMLVEVGKPGWESGLNENNWRQRVDDFWTKRYPSFGFALDKMFKSKENRPFESRWYNNVISSTRKNFENPSQVSIRDTKNVSNAEFVNVNNLNLALKNPSKFNQPNIPFNSIGLYKDTFRCSVPNKDKYRAAVKRNFDRYPVHSGDKYNVNTINQRLYFNTGKLVYSTITCGNNVPEQTIEEVPIGKFISLQKSGGDRKFIRADRDNNRLLTDRTVVKGWEKFLVEKHPKGGIALRAVSNGKYVYVHNKRTEAALQPNGNGKFVWEQLEWKSMGNGKVALKSMHNGKWLQAAWNEDNGLVRARGERPLQWETFNWKAESPEKFGSKNLTENFEIVVYPIPASNTLTIEATGQLSGAVKYEIYNTLGNTLLSGYSTNPVTELNISSLSTGVYFIKIINEEKVQTISFIKK